MPRNVLVHRRAALGILAALSACAQAGGPGAPGALPYSSADTSGPPQPLDSAVRIAADRVLSTTPAAPARQLVVIDPLVNGITGEQSVATQGIQQRILDVARQNYPQFDFVPFSAAAVARTPLVMVGTFTPISTSPKPERDAFRFCLVMGDTRTGKAVAKAVTKAQTQAVDTTPTKFFQDSPGWTDDAMIKSYVATCQATKVGDPIPPAYINGLLTAAIISDATDAYGAARYREALDLYQSARQTQAGDQLRVYNGLYLTHLHLGQREQATQAFSDLVDYSIKNKRLAMKILFKPGSTALAGPDGGMTDQWLREIARGAARRSTCLQVSGHTSRSGAAALNDRLSQLRAEYIVMRLEREQPSLHGRLIAAGFGASQNLVGTGADDASDALDRRVEFRVLESCT